DLLDRAHPPREQPRRRPIADEDAGRSALVRRADEGADVRRLLDDRRQPDRKPHRHLEDLVARQRSEQGPTRSAALQHADERWPQSAYTLSVSSHYLGIGGCGHVGL